MKLFQNQTSKLLRLTLFNVTQPAYPLITELKGHTIQISRLSFIALPLITTTGLIPFCSKSIDGLRLAK